MSASDPTAMRPEGAGDTSEDGVLNRHREADGGETEAGSGPVPFRGYMLKSLAALVLVTATNSFSSIFPENCKEKEEIQTFYSDTFPQKIFETRMNVGSTRVTRKTYHRSVPDHRHPLLDAVGSFGDQGEVVLADGLLRRGEAGLRAGGHLEVTAAGGQRSDSARREAAGGGANTHQASREVRYCGVEGSGLRGGLVTKAAAVAQSLDQ